MTVNKNLYRIYKDTGILNLVYVWIKLKIAPFLKLEEYVPKKGRILDLGCGRGVFANIMALSSDDREIEGSDIDKRKIDVARRTVSSGKNLSFQISSIFNISQTGNHKYDAVILSDILYLIPLSQYENIFKACFNIINSGGVLIVKEMNTRPYWKYILTLFQETLAVKVTKFTFSYNEKFELHSCDVFKRILSNVFPRVKDVRLDKGYAYPHIAYICKK